jgi:predicted nucleotidyltransferase
MDRETAHQQIARICGVWIREAGPEKIILFGSAARGEMTEDSDLDFLVVWEGREFPNNRRRAGYLMKILPDDVTAPIDVIVMTPEQYRSEKEDDRTLTAMVTDEGKVLYERDERVA